MRILTTLTYYRPHYSGLTIYAERLARALTRRGHQVTVLTSRYDRSLPAREVRDGVQVIRPHVLMHVSKGVLMPSMWYWAWVNIRRADVVHLHLPQLDASYIALISRLLHKPVVLTYHCDLLLPKGFIHAIANQVSHLANHMSLSLSNEVVVNTLDYARESAFLRHYLLKIRAIPTPVELASPTQDDLQSLKEKAMLEPGQRVIGMVARLAAEKGVEYLVEAMPEILKRHPQARVLHVGQYQNVLGEEEYAAKLKPRIEALDNHWTFMGILPAAELAAFYQLCDVTVLPSTNSTESFGIVQVESMASGTPVVASNIPGVREPVKITGMGRLIPPADAHSLAQGINEVLDQPERYTGDVEGVKTMFSSEHIAEAYEQLFRSLLKERTITRSPVENAS
ncbi:MAG: glycosyltransferase family 1 protein [Anaerolineales bacterium]|nr:glycosyltransferase family 4 protein [Anaerolineae bacterium]PWB56372.1 MAG: glycosyltransferase family 1 protein [Anaerolineales bacterium]